MSGFKNPFKGQKGPKKSAISRTAEREFERETKKIESLDEYTKKIHKDMKRCIDCHNAQARSGMRVVQDLQTSNLCKEDDGFRDDVESLAEASSKLEVLIQELNANSQKTIIEPMRKFQTLVPGVHQSVKKREQSLQEYNKCQTKVEKYVDKERTGQNLVKLETGKKALSTAKEDFEAQNKLLMEEMPKLYEGRIDYFQPSFQALIKSQVKYYTDSHAVYSELSNRLEEGDGGESPESFDMAQTLQEIRALQITLDD